MSQSLSQQPGEKLVQLGDLTFTVAPGLTIEQATTPDLVHWPVVADWDSEGRLVVVESGGVAKPIEEHNKQLLHRVVRLVDSDRDGRFDKRIVAADKLPFPEGVLCLGNTMLVSAPPVIWQLTDQDGDGVCEQRSVWFDAKTLTGCANDLHGPYLGRDGWIYWCKGAFAEQSREMADGTVVKDSAAHIYRRRFSGGAVEAVMSGGMDNPVEVAITPEGERFFDSTFLQHPGNGLRDGIAHAIYGGVYGKDHGVIDGLPRTGPLMPIMTQLGPAAPSGLMVLEQNRLLPTDRSMLPKRFLVAALFNLQKVTAHRLIDSGSTFTTQDFDLVKANRVDFHPTDVIEDSDGSLIIVDTGGWYDLCCPTSRVDQHTAAGGIYRLRPAKLLPSPVAKNVSDWSKLTPEQCVALIHDPRPWVSRMANWTLNQHGNDAFGNAAAEKLSQQIADANNGLEVKLRALWGLSHLGSESSLASVIRVLDDPSPNLVQAACHIVAVHRVAAARESLHKLLTHDRPAVQRVAAEALGRVGDASSTKRLMDLLGNNSEDGNSEDRILSHSFQYAVLELKDSDVIREYLTVENHQQRLVAMRLLEQLSPGTLPAEVILAAARSEMEELRQAGWSYLKSRRELADAVLPLLTKNLYELSSQTIETQNVNWNEWADLLNAWRDEPAVQELIVVSLAEAANDASRKEEVVEVLLQLLDAWHGEPVPERSFDSIVKLLQASPQQLLPHLAGFDLSEEAAQPLLVRMQQAVAGCESAEQRLQWLAYLPASHGFSDDALANDLATRVAVGDTNALSLLQRLQLNTEIAGQLIDATADSSASTLMQIAELVSSLRNDDVDTRLLQQLSRLPASRAIPASFLTNLYHSRSETLKKHVDNVVVQLSTPEENVAAVVKQTLESLPSGDAVRGLEVFRGAKAACAACHQMGYVGGKIGPELTRIGQSRTREALLEAVLFPSSRIEQSFQAIKVMCTDGQIHNGLVVRENNDELVLQVAADRTVTIPRDTIEEQRTSEVSIMPTGMLELLNSQELADLLSLLEQAR